MALSMAMKLFRCVTVLPAHGNESYAVTTMKRHFLAGLKSRSLAISGKTKEEGELDEFHYRLKMNNRNISAETNNKEYQWAQANASSPSYNDKNEDNGVHYQGANRGDKNYGSRQDNPLENRDFPEDNNRDNYLREWDNTDGNANVQRGWNCSDQPQSENLGAGKAPITMIIIITVIFQIGKGIAKILTIKTTEIRYTITAGMNIGTVQKTEGLGPVE